MRVLIGIGHPAHVHLFKNLAWGLIKDGHKVEFVAVDKDCAISLLKAYGFKHGALGEIGSSLLGKIGGLISLELRSLCFALRFKPDIYIGRVLPYLAHISWLLRRPMIAFEDTEHAALVHWLGAPFISTICTSESFRKNFGEKHIRYNSYDELAYLHPNYLRPDPSVLDELGLTKSDKFIIVRFVAWQAIHDTGQQGFDMVVKRRLIRQLEEYARVFITSESPLPSEFEKYRLTTSPEKIHDLLYHATMYIGEGATMATEAAILGTPSIYVSTLFETIGHYEELEKEYGLLYSFGNQQEALEKALEILSQDNIKEQWKVRREKMLRDKIDVTQFMTDFVENYPQSFIQYQKNKHGKIL